MLHTVSSREFLVLQHVKERYDESRVGYAVPIMAAITARWLAELKGPRLSVLLFIMNRTILCGKSAQRIAMAEFETGVKDEDFVHCCGTGLSKSTITEALKWLQTEDFLSVYRTITGTSGVESEPRMFEIDFKKLLHAGELSDKNCVVEVTEVDKSDTVAPRLLGRGGPGIRGGHNDIYIGDYITSLNILDKTSLISPLAFGSRKKANEKVGVEMFVGKQKKPRATLGYDNAADAVAAIKQRDQQKQTTRVASAATKQPSVLTRQEMQAVFDKHATAISLGFRLMVTSREYGFLKKRLADNPPKDFSDFVRWTLTYWGTMAQQNQAAVRKDRDRLVKGKTLPAAPHFYTFTYWYPYFFRAYQNHLAGKVIETAPPVDEKDREIARLQRQVAQERHNTVILRRRPQAAPTPPEPRPAATRARILPAKTTDDDLFSPIAFGEWITKR